MDYSTHNKRAYDSLADEYEARVESLLPVTEEAMEYFSKYLKSGGKVLDVGCAVGIAINVLSKKGFSVTGVEISEEMAAYARKRNPESEIIVGDYLKTELNERFDGILAFAFIHLFPKKQVESILKKMEEDLVSGGVALISSTESEESWEGWQIKEDFNKKEKRFRKQWTEEELKETIIQAGFEVKDLMKFEDPYGKTWMDFIAQKPKG